MEDDDPASATGAVTSKVKDQHKVTRSCDQSEPSWPNVVAVSLEAGGGIPCRPNPAATLIVFLRLPKRTSKQKQSKFSSLPIL